MSADRLELPQGTLDLLSLKTVALEPQHGWAISQRLHQLSSATWHVHQGSLCPALHRLERRGWFKTFGRIEQQLPPEVLRTDKARPHPARNRNHRPAQAQRGHRPSARIRVVET